MNKLRAYHTGLWVIRDRNFPKGSFSGKGWSITFAKDKSTYATIREGSEVIIRARSWKTAQQATNLILTAIILLTGDSMSDLTHRRPFAFAEDDKTIQEMPPEMVEFARGYSLCTPDIAVACKVAIDASKNRHYSYALTKFYLSCSIYSTPIIDLDPSHSGNLRLSPFYEDHVRFATSILLAYSAIEELNLHLKASPDNPSRLANGEWNPIVRTELENRLKKGGIDLSKAFLWTIRGSSRRIEKKRPARPLSKPKWTHGTVRDVNVNILDAISDASWLRSKVSAHGFNKLAPSLSPYDVANVQHLAGRLILETLGYWE